MNQTESTSPVSLSSFSFMDFQSLKTLKTELGLYMSLSELRACQSYYRSVLNRDPLLEELTLLDRIVAGNRRTASAFLVAEMETLSPRIAETFADLIRHRRAVSPALNHPISLKELAETAERYLGADDKPNPLSDVAVRFNPHRDLLMACEGYVKCASTGNKEEDVTIGYKPQEKNRRQDAPKEGDYVYAILNARTENELIEFLASDEVRGAAKKIVPLLNRCLLAALAETADGLTIHAQVTAELDLTAPTFGALITAAPADSADMLLMAQDVGIRLIRIATVTSDELLHIPPKDGKPQVFHTSFIRSLSAALVYAAKVEVPEDGNFHTRLSRIGTCTLNEQKHAVVKTDASGDDAYAAALYGILYAFLHCFAAGAAPTQTGLACRLSLPLAEPNAARVGTSLAAILGTYRMQAEFELLGNAPTLEITGDKIPSVSAVTVAPLPPRPIPSSVVGGGTSIFYLEPLYTEDGLPDFNDLKKMLSYVEKLIHDGHVLSILPTGTDLLAALGKMSEQTTVEYVRHDSLSSHVGGLLVETNTHIQGTLVAVTPSPVSQKEADKQPTDGE